ncbi:MAG: hypothetical protein LBU26_06235 [Synergistaceae bacterium]|jgi:hypothetical protein|nr:hypothetical protein [Synergistaceae bacterium]
MDFGGDNRNCVIATCRIDGKDSSGNSVCGFFMCVTDGRDVLYDGELFSRTPFDMETPLSEMFAVLSAPRPDDRSEEFSRCEAALSDFIRSSRIFQSEKNLDDQKSLEHKITYFCTSVLSINAISFLEISEMSKHDLYLAIPPLKRGEENETERLGPQDESKPGEAGTQGGGTPDVVVACEPVLDPVGGVAISELAKGTAIYCKMKTGSVFYNLMENASPEFDGIVKGDVTAVSINELGSGTVVLKLSDGVSGAMKAASTVRVKVVAKSNDEPGKAKPPAVEIFFAIAGVVIFLCIMALLLYWLS